MAKTLDTHLPLIVDHLFAPSPLVEWLVNGPYIISGQDRMRIRNALFKRSRKVRAAAAALLDKLAKVPRKGKEGDVISYK